MKMHVLVSRRTLAVAILATLAVAVGHAQQGKTGGEVAQAVTVLTATPHPPMPRELTQIWLAPDRTAARSATNATISSAARLFAGGDYSKAIAAVSQQTAQQGPLALYATYYTGVSQLRLEKPADALKSFTAIAEQKPVGYLAEAAVLGQADALLALNKPSDAVSLFEAVLKQRPSRVEDVLMRLGRAAKAAGAQDKAAEAFGRVYYEFALGDLATAAGTELALMNVRSVTPNSPRFALEMGRAQRLYSAKRYKDARDAYDNLRSLASGDDRNLIRLRIAECDYFLKKLHPARDVAKELAEGNGPRRAEALFFYAVAARDLGDAGTYLTTIRRIANEFPSDPFAEEALNSLGTYYILRDEDERADDAFREMFGRFPTGNYAERAAWKAGWRAYRLGKYADTVKFFEQASSDFPRSDYRPSWLYWSARAHEKLSNQTLANLRYGIVVADYLNSYYGRMAAARLGANANSAAKAATASIVTNDIPLPSSLPPNSDTIKALLGAEMFDDALNELRYARRTWGENSTVDATIAWTNQQLSRNEKGMARFQLVRGAINTMRRAYPQFMTAEGSMLPHDVQTVIYPVAYWDLVKKYSAQNGLDPYLIGALVLQESTYVADIRSHANAYGLMQLMPSTARQYARKLGIPYSARVLTDPELNIRMGTAYFADKIKEFGGVHLALASYNAGERPVRTWMATRPSIDQDEFIDDIPYPETQGYVRKILGTAEDYRRLYGGVDASQNGLDKTPVVDASPAPVVTPAAKTPVTKAPAAKTPAPASVAPKTPAPKTVAPKKPAPKAPARKPATPARRQ